VPFDDRRGYVVDGRKKDSSGGKRLNEQGEARGMTGAEVGAGRDKCGMGIGEGCKEQRKGGGRGGGG